MSSPVEQRTSDESPQALQAQSTAIGTENPAQKKSRLMQYRATPSPAVSLSKTALQELHEYLRHPDCTEISSFWSGNRFDLPKLAHLVYNILCVPASSSPIERVFSAAGIIFRPHRARMAYSTLQCLVFLKVNRRLLKCLSAKAHV